ncbi:MAG: OmpH family outer membrane protein [Sphingomonadales bacterium]|nr:OmpH family outer membrane protein [Sphingomonadales bacterium]
MKTIFKALALASVATTGVVALAPVASAQAVQGLGVADLDDAVSKSNAAVLAANQIKITHKATIDAVEARTGVLNNEYRTMVQAFQTAQRAPNPNQAALQQQAAAIQKKQQDAQTELQNLARPYSLAEAYAMEQIRGKLEQAVRNAMTKKRVSVLLQPNALILPAPSADITTDVIAELNALVPNVSITPPAGWPQQGGAAPAAGAAPARPAQPQSR